jgi:methylated-DNA-[protein]-cysteine S-methyltransferase
MVRPGLVASEVMTPGGTLNIVFDPSSATVLASCFGPLEQVQAQLGLGTSPIAAGALPDAIGLAFAAYRAGDAQALDTIAVNLDHLGPFARRVSEAMRQVAGTITYGALAARAGYPGAARAVGTVCATNRAAVIIPCHRVVRAGGDLGNYGYGVDIKRALLQAEGAELIR